MKLTGGIQAQQTFVAPHAGAGIEIIQRVTLLLRVSVAPHAGAGIEIIPLKVNVNG